MAIGGNGRPNVRALASRGDTAGLVEAACFQDMVTSDHGDTVDRGAPVREAAILALGALGGDSGTEAVLAALGDPVDRVRVAAVRVLYARQAATELAEAVARLPADDGYSRPLAFEAVAQLKRPDCAPALANALVRAEGSAPLGDDERQLLTGLLAEDGSQAVSAVVEVLVSALGDPSAVVADRASDLLTMLGPDSTDAVIAELQDGAAPHRAAAVLGGVKATRAIEPLKRGLEHADFQVRAESAVALGELRDPAAVEALIHAIADPDHRVRAAAGRALDGIGSAAVVLGVATLVRPMIADALASSDEAPFPTRGNGANRSPSTF